MKAYAKCVVCQERLELTETGSGAGMVSFAPIFDLREWLDRHADCREVRPHHIQVVYEDTPGAKT